MFHAGFFYYMLVESGTAKFMINCHSLTLKKGDMLLVTPRMSVSLKSKSMEFNSYGICIEPSFFDSLAVGSYAYKSLYNAGSMTLALQLDNDDFAYVHKTLELLVHSLTFNYPVEMMSHLVNFLLLQITKIVDNKVRVPLERSAVLTNCSACSENYWPNITDMNIPLLFMRTGFMCPVLIFQDYTSGFWKDSKYLYNGGPSL